MTSKKSQKQVNKYLKKKMKSTLTRINVCST